MPKIYSKFGHGFKFADRHSSEFYIVAKSDDRSLLPAKRRNEFVIPGRDGVADFGMNNFEKRTISVTLGIIAHSLEELRERARVAAKWLSGEGLLIFDDEPDKTYRAKIYRPLSLANLVDFGSFRVRTVCGESVLQPNNGAVH